MAQSKVTIIAELQDRLTGPLKKAKQSVEDTTKSVEDHGKKADKAFGKAAKSAEESATKTTRATSRLEKALDGAGDSASGMAREFGQAETKVGRALDDMARDSKTAASDIDRHLGVAGEQGGRGMVSNLKAAGTKFVSEAKSIGREAGDKLAAGIESALSQIDSSPIAGIAGGAGIIGGVTASLQRDSTSRTAAAATGSDPEAMRELIDGAYRDNFGENYDQVALGADAIIGTFDVEPGSPEAERLLRGNLSLEKVFGLDPKMLSFGIDLFMNADDLDAGSAQDVMAGLLQSAAPAARDELLDNLNEYLPLLTGTGMSATGIGTFMAQASQIGGQYGSDKTGDVIKEWEAIARDPNKAQMDAYSELGIDPAEIVDLMNQDRGEEAWRMTAEALHNADPADQGRLAVNTLGSMMEDLGLSNVDEYTGMWKEATTDASAYQGVMDGITGTMKEGEGAAFGRMIRAAGESIVAIGDEIAPILTPFFETLTQVAPVVGPVLALFSGISALKFAGKGLKWITGLGDDLGKVGKNGAKASGAMGGLRGALLRHPIGWLAAGVWLASDAFKALYEHSDLFRGVVDGVGDAWERAKANMSDYIDMADDALSKHLGLENNGGHREAKEMQNADIRPDWWKETTRPWEEALGLGPQSKPHEGLFSLPKVDEAEEEKHADGGWTSGNRMYRAGERGREFVTNAWASQKIESGAPGALAYMNATGNLPSVGAGAGDTIIVDARGSNLSEAQIRSAVEQALVRQGRKASRTHATPTARGAR